MEEYKINKELESENDRKTIIGKSFKTDKFGEYVVLGASHKNKGKKMFVIEFKDTKNKYITTKWAILRGRFEDKNFLIGKTMKSNRFGYYKVIKEVKRRIEKTRARRQFEVEFELTGFKAIYTIDAIKLGSIRDPFYPIYYGKAYCGVGEWASSIDNVDTREYKLWRNMLSRCYDSNFHKKRPTYIGCTVHSEWWNFQTFCKDILILEKYGKWAENKKRYLLDKDILIKGNKVYSKYTCMFVDDTQSTASDNKSQTVTGLTYKAIKLESDYEEIFYNMSLFARKYNLKSSIISEYLRGLRKSPHKGWIFETIETTK